MAIEELQKDAMKAQQAQEEDDQEVVEMVRIYICICISYLIFIMQLKSILFLCHFNFFDL